MNYEKITVNSGIMSLGNTGARLSDPRYYYPELLRTLSHFRGINQNNWNSNPELQKEFVKFFNENEKIHISIKEDNKISSDKDIRCKVSFLDQMGFITEDKFLTKIGNKLMNSENLSSYENEFDIAADSYLYLLQLVKYQVKNFKILPLNSLIYCCLDNEEGIDLDFFKYFWVRAKTKNELIFYVNQYKNIGYKKIIYQQVKDSEKTEIARKNIYKHFNSFSKYTIPEKEARRDLFMSIFPHAKGDTFKEKVIKLYEKFEEYWTEMKKLNRLDTKFDIILDIKGRYEDACSYNAKEYQLFLFNTQQINSNSNKGIIINYFESLEIMQSNSLEEFILNFHIFYMYIKDVSICNEYFSLNIGNISLTDIFIIEDNKIKLDTLPLYFFRQAGFRIIDINVLEEDVYRKHLENEHPSLSDINPIFNIKKENIYQLISEDYSFSANIKDIVRYKKQRRMNSLIENKFNKETIVEILKLMEKRKDSTIYKKLKEELNILYFASIPALFEYLVGISFYWIKEKNVDVFSILNMKLDSNLMPISHAPGNNPDLLVKSDNEDIIIEVTLSNNDNQRRMEMEPVSRHLGKHMLENKQKKIFKNAYCLFVAPYLDPNVLVSFRNMKFSRYYDTNNSYNFVEGLNIIPFSISELIWVLEKNINYEELIEDFKEIVMENITIKELNDNSDITDGFRWYKERIQKLYSPKILDNIKIGSYYTSPDDVISFSIDSKYSKYITLPYEKAFSCKKIYNGDLCVNLYSSNSIIIMRSYLNFYHNDEFNVKFSIKDSKKIRVIIESVRYGKKCIGVIIR